MEFALVLCFISRFIDFYFWFHFNKMVHNAYTNIFNIFVLTLLFSIYLYIWTISYTILSLIVSLILFLVFKKS